MSDAWTILLVGEDNGIVGRLGDAFDKSPEHYRRTDVVRADLYERLQEENEGLRNQIKWHEDRDKARLTLLPSGAGDGRRV